MRAEDGGAAARLLREARTLSAATLQVCQPGREAALRAVPLPQLMGLLRALRTLVAGARDKLLGEHEEVRQCVGWWVAGGGRGLLPRCPGRGCKPEWVHSPAHGSSAVRAHACR